MISLRSSSRRRASRRLHAPLAAAWLVAALAASFVSNAAATSLTSFEYLGRAVLPPGLLFRGTTVGGLSALAWDEERGELLALSDDRSERQPSRFYRLRVALDGDRLDDGGVTVVDVATLCDRAGRPFPARALDPEGLAIAGRRLFFSSEGEAKVGNPPRVFEIDARGRVLGELTIPSRFRPAAGRGVRDNQAFEALAATPDGATLFVGTEGPLTQDGPAVDAGRGARVRILRYDLAAGRQPPSEFLDALEPLFAAPGAADAFRLGGLSDLLALDATHLVALERQFVAGVGNSARLCELDLARATDTADFDALDSLAGGVAAPAAKTALLDLGELPTGLALDNFEGLAFGPRLADGRRVLFLISDDNFHPLQRTILLALAVGELRLEIHDLQGVGHRSPFAGRWVAGIEGVVTAVDRGDPRLFWIEGTRPDADPGTSEGILVATKSALALPIGERVRVAGRVEERAANPRELTVTTLAATAVEKLAAGDPLPAPPRLGARLAIPTAVDDDGLAHFEPATDAIDLWESLESMRLTVPGGAVVGPTTAYGEIALWPDGSPDLQRTRAGGLRLESGAAPPPRVLLSARVAGRTPQLNVGARLAGPITGVVEYGHANYHLAPLAPLAVAAARGATCDARSTLADGALHLTVATWNVENLSIAGPAERFDRLAHAIVERLRSPALVGLQEIQDDSGPADDGTVTATATLARLVAAIRSAGGPAYEVAAVDPEENREGGQPGANIRVALLVDPARATIVRRGAAGALDAAEPVAEGKGKDRILRLTSSPARVAPTSEEFSGPPGEGVRRSLAVELAAGGRPLFVVVNHWSSRSGDDRAFGASQPPRTPTASRRLGQARQIRAFLDRLLAVDPAARVAVLGDLNDDEASPPLFALAAPPWTDLATRVAVEERYSFDFEGGSSLLDHVLVSPALAAGAEIEIPHFDADCHAGLRASDHDPLVARLALPPSSRRP
ncbi:MAG: esterase-like activity of phytase family protein [Thermoanaerobaculia bacterium]